MMQDEAHGVIAVKIVFAVPFVGRVRQVDELGGLRAEKLEGGLVAGEQGGGQLHLALLLEAVEGFVHDGGAGLLFFARQQLHVAEPGEEIVELQLGPRRGVGELGELRLCVPLENVDEVGQQVIVEADAVEENLENIARLGPDRLLRRGGRGGGLLRLLRLRGRGQLGDGGVQLGGVEAVVLGLGDLGAVLRGAGADEGGDAHLSDPGLQLQRLFQIVLLAQRKPLRRLPRPLADLGEILQIIRNERHNRPPVFSFSVPCSRGNVKSLGGAFGKGYGKLQQICRCGPAFSFASPKENAGKRKRA